MKRSLFSSLVLTICCGLALALGVAACNSLPTLQQQFTTACGVVNGDLQVIGTSPPVSPDNQVKIMTQVLPANKAICAAGIGVNVTSLRAFHDSLLPVAVGIVQATPTLPDQTMILLALNTFGPLVQAQIDMLLTAIAPTAPAVIPAPASAPVAASGALSASAFTLK